MKVRDWKFMEWAILAVVVVLVAACVWGWQKIGDMADKVADVDATNEALNAELIELEEDNAKVSDERDHWKEEAKDASATVAAQASDLASATAEIARLQRELTRAKTDSPKIVPQAKTTPKPKAPAPAPTKTAYSTKGVEQWRPLVAKWVKAYGGSDANVDQFLSVMRKESGGNPRAKGPTITWNGKRVNCLGLMQIHPCHADKFRQKTGQPYSPGVFDAEANIKFAAYMSNGGRNWSSWSAKP